MSQGSIILHYNDIHMGVTWYSDQSGQWTSVSNVMRISAAC